MCGNAHPLSFGLKKMQRHRVAKIYIPKEGDQVFLEGQGFTQYIVTRVERRKQTVQVKNISGKPIVIFSDIPWSELLPSEGLDGISSVEV